MRQKIFLKQLPNALSCCRIVLSPLLLLTVNNEMVFLLLYTICGLTDFADGFIARKYNVATSIGAKLDSFADVIFSISTLYIIYSQLQMKSDFVILFAAVIFVVRIMNMIITKIKFKQWNVIHTIGNKAAGLALFLVLPIYFLFNLISPNFMIAFAVLAALASFEETCILMISSNYDVNRKSLFRCIDGKIFTRYTEHVLNKKKINLAVWRNTQ